MDDAPVVCRFQGVCDMSGHPQRLGERQCAGHEPFDERRAVHELEDEGFRRRESGLLHLLEAVNGANVRMTQRRQDARLALETGGALRVVRRTRGAP